MHVLYRNLAHAWLTQIKGYGPDLPLGGVGACRSLRVSNARACRKEI